MEHKEICECCAQIRGGQQRVIWSFNLQFETLWPVQALAMGPPQYLTCVCDRGGRSDLEDMLPSFVSVSCQLTCMAHGKVLTPRKGRFSVCDVFSVHILPRLYVVTLLSSC